MSGAADVASPAPASAHPLLVDVYLGARLAVAGFSAMLPILGALSTGAAPGSVTLLALVAVALLFHVFAYLLNDVMDLDIDRREPQRAAFPLVRGALTPAAALAIAAAQPPLAFGVTLALGGEAMDFALLAAAFAALALYDVWGKRCAFPPLMDLVQAVGWASLLLYGAAIAGTPAPATAWTALSVTAYVLLVNGVHGALRDLANDAACGARTTAMWLGARVSAGAVCIPRALIGYALGLHGALFVGAAAAWLAARPLRDGVAASVGLLAALPASLGLLVAVMGWTVVLLGQAARHRGEPARARAAATTHLFACMALLAVPLLATLDAATALVLAAVYALPILAMILYRRRERR